MSDPKKVKVSRGTLKTAKRLLAYVTSSYKPELIAVVICIIMSSIASISVSLSLKFLLDDFIIPLIGKQNPDFTELYRAVVVLGVIFLLGVIATFVYTRLMVKIGQGVLRRVRDEMFEHMQTLPIRYFDQNTNGSIMSLYTNDTDTLRQMISQSIPQIVNSLITIVSVFVSMVILSVPLTVLTLVMVSLMLFATKSIAGRSGKYFIEQQKNLGTVNGFIEEMMDGQKVVKVFCHEEENIENFRKLNDRLFESADRANTFANILGPVNAQMGNISYVLCAIVGGVLALSGISGLTLGGLASFLTFNKSFNMPINQVSQQLNSVVMAMAGAERIFQLMDENSEEDHGYVTLVNARREKDGTLTETKEKTGVWAWRHPHQDGTVTLTELRGDVRLANVDFAYEEEKWIYREGNFRAEPGEIVALIGPSGQGKTTTLNILGGMDIVTSR